MVLNPAPALAALSLVMAIATVLAVPILIVRLPPDHFTRDRRGRRPLVRALRASCGAVLIVAGTAMLALPGQGILTLLLGLWLLDFPASTRLVRRMLRHPRVARGVNALRAKAGQPPFDVGKLA